MLKAVKLTSRQRVLLYAQQHGLDVSGSERQRWIRISDKQGHWSEAWHLPSCETWAEAEDLLSEIERNHWSNEYRPWEISRQSYTGKMKPLAA